MPAPLLPILVAVAGLAALALSSKKSSAAGAASGVPSYPVAAGALNSAAGQPANAGAPAPVSFLPAPPTISVPPIFGSPPVAAPAPVAVAAPPDGGGAVTVLPVTIVGQPTPTSDPTAGQTVPWDSGSMVLPSPSSLPAIPANYAESSQETSDVQYALNNWAAAVGFQAVDAKGANIVPLATDGLYGPDTQLCAAGFQVWANASGNAGLAVDGLAGPMTQTPLLDWGTISPGGPY